MQLEFFNLLSDLRRATQELPPEWVPVPNLYDLATRLSQNPAVFWEPPRILATFGTTNHVFGKYSITIEPTFNAEGEYIAYFNAYQALILSRGAKNIPEAVNKLFPIGHLIIKTIKYLESNRFFIETSIRTVAWKCGHAKASFAHSDGNLGILLTLGDKVDWVALEQLPQTLSPYLSIRL
jgi:hypothetical protein